MRFIDETDCNPAVSNGSDNVLSTSKIKTILLLRLDFAYEFARYISRMISRLQ